MNSNRERVVEILRRLGEADFDGVGVMLAESFVQEYPYRPTPESPDRIDGRAPFVEFCRAGMSAFEPYRFRVLEVFETTDSRTLVAEYSSHTQLRSTGAPYSNRYIAVFTFADDGLLARWREYLNPQIIADTFGRKF